MTRFEKFNLLTTVQVNDDFEASATSPTDSLVQVRELTIDVRVALQGRKSPVADGNTNVVHARGGDLVEVILGNEAAPVLIQHGPALISANGGTKGPLVNSGIASGIKKRWGDPRLQHKPTTEVDTTDLVSSVVEGKTPARMLVFLCN